jgi:hypothetical protein
MALGTARKRRQQVGHHLELIDWVVRSERGQVEASGVFDDLTTRMALAGLDIGGVMLMDMSLGDPLPHANGKLDTRCELDAEAKARAGVLLLAYRTLLVLRWAEPYFDARDFARAADVSEELSRGLLKVQEAWDKAVRRDGPGPATATSLSADAALLNLYRTLVQRRPPTPGEGVPDVLAFATLMMVRTTQDRPYFMFLVNGERTQEMRARMDFYWQYCTFVEAGLG